MHWLYQAESQNCSQFGKQNTESSRIIAEAESRTCLIPDTERRENLGLHGPNELHNPPHVGDLGEWLTGFFIVQVKRLSHVLLLVHQTKQDGIENNPTTDCIQCYFSENEAGKHRLVTPAIPMKASL